MFATVVGTALLANGGFEIWSAYREQRALLIRVQHEQAVAAAVRMGGFIQDIERQLGWVGHFPWAMQTLEQHRIDALRLLRQAPAIAELIQLDETGKERLRVSRVALDTAGRHADYSLNPLFTEAVAHGAHFGPVYFRRESEPYMAISLRGGMPGAGVSIAEVNLKLIWDVVAQIRAGNGGVAYAVDARGRLVAHPDIGLVLRNTDLSALPQIAAARAGTSLDEAIDVHGQSVLTSFAPVESLGWLVFVEVPLHRAYAPLYASLRRAAGMLGLGVLLAGCVGVVLARRMVAPIKALSTGAARLGRGELDQRITIRTGDELEELGEQFNRMAARLQDSYATLEARVQERTQALAVANDAKSRFLAAASHDLRQPLHALGLFLAQLRDETEPGARSLLITRLEAALTGMSELFNALLDLSRLDAGAMQPKVSAFPVQKLLDRIETNFMAIAAEKGLRFRVVPSAAWVRSDPILLERILINLVSNAVRYTVRGGVVVGCRRRRQAVQVEVWDTGPGIPDSERRKIFAEFYRLPGADRAGLGLGLAIVDRLAVLLDHPLRLWSIEGRGSHFALTVPATDQQLAVPEPPATQSTVDPMSGKVVVVIDDDALVREGTSKVLAGWGCRVAAAASVAELSSTLDERPDLIISDYNLSETLTGVDAILTLRARFGTKVPALLVTGEVGHELAQRTLPPGIRVLRKPVAPITLRAVATWTLRSEAVEPDRADKRIDAA